MSTRTCRRDFNGTPASGRAARQFVTSVLSAWQCDTCLEHAALCAAELAANAVLHTRGPFTVGVRETSSGVRVEVSDARPDDVPITVPVAATGATSATSLTEGTTGRGLQIVAAVSDCWGITTKDGTKTVWAEVSGESPAAPTDAIVDASEESAPADHRLTVHFLDLPVRLAIASGAQVDELVREVQLGLFDESIGDEARTRFYELLDRSAPARLAGRRAALDAAAAGRERFDMDLVLDKNLSKAVGAFRALLETLPLAVPGAPSVTTPDVVAFRTWLDAETAAQMQGNPPSPCPMH